MILGCTQYVVDGRVFFFSFHEKIKSRNFEDSQMSSPTAA
jgi:hypothetical protein